MKPFHVSTASTRSSAATCVHVCMNQWAGTLCFEFKIHLPRALDGCTCTT